MNIQSLLWGSGVKESFTHSLSNNRIPLGPVHPRAAITQINKSLGVGNVGGTLSALSKLSLGSPRTPINKLNGAFNRQALVGFTVIICIHECAEC